MRSSFVFDSFFPIIFGIPDLVYGLGFELGFAVDFDIGFSLSLVLVDLFLEIVWKLGDEVKF